MKTPSQVVDEFYDICNRQQGRGLDSIVATEITFEGPLMRLSGAAQYVSTVGPFLKFHQSMKLLRQFADCEHVCSIYEMTFGTPTGGAVTSTFADWIRVVDGKVAEQKLYYDPREFAKAFGM